MTKANLKYVTDVNTSKFTKKIDLGSLESEVDELDIDNLENVSTG